jgi:hypothetical protein
MLVSEVGVPYPRPEMSGSRHGPGSNTTIGLTAYVDAINSTLRVRWYTLEPSDVRDLAPSLGWTHISVPICESCGINRAIRQPVLENDTRPRPVTSSE